MSKDLVPPFPTNSPRSALRPLVLIAEDHADTRSLYKYVLELHGYAVAEAEKGEEAIRLVKELHPDLVLMDTNLPEVDGLTATQRLREEVSLRDLPIIFISGHAQPEIRAAALAAGGNDYLVKPTSLGELEASVEKHLSAVRSHNHSRRCDNNREPRGETNRTRRENWKGNG